jgi:hypothetical protein
LRDPVCKRIFAVLNNRSAGLVAIITSPRLPGSHWGLVDQVYEMLSESGDNRQLFAVFTKGIELIIERSLDLLTGDVGQLCLGDEGLGLCANEFLFENNNLGGVWFLIFEMCNLVGNLLLS